LRRNYQTGIKTPAAKAGFLIFVVTVIGQANKTELNNARRIILRRNHLALKTFGKPKLNTSTGLSLFILFVINAFPDGNGVLHHILLNDERRSSS
jgi:hypothetical protein